MMRGKMKERGRDLKGIKEEAEECRWCRFLWHDPHETNVTVSPQQHWGYDLTLSREGTWTHENIIPRMAAMCVCVCEYIRVFVGFHFQGTEGDWVGTNNFYDFCHITAHTLKHICLSHGPSNNQTFVA